MARSGHAPARATKALSANALIVSNAAGGLNPHYAVGDVMVIEDHINFMFANPLIGVNDDRLGPRFPDMSSPYDREFMEVARSSGTTSRLCLASWCVCRDVRADLRNPC